MKIMMKVVSVCLFAYSSMAFDITFDQEVHKDAIRMDKKITKKLAGNTIESIEYFSDHKYGRKIYHGFFLKFRNQNCDNKNLINRFDVYTYEDSENNIEVYIDTVPVLQP